MDTQPAIDRSLLIPISIGAFSIVGIIVVLLIGRALNAPPEVAPTPSATRFQYLFLGTEPAITTPLTEGSEFPLTEAPVEEEPDLTTPVFATSTAPTVSTPAILTPPNSVSTPTGNLPGAGTLTPTLAQQATSTATLSSPVAANNYDDTDSRLSYSGNWLPQTNVSGAYQGTLHISDSIGNFVSFTFTGDQIQLYYQAGASLGTVTITFDDDTLGTQLNQSQGGVWVYSLDTAGPHTVVITHSSGGSVNIDRLVIPGPTATPSRTPTATP
ncbi:MAG TPA: hypothetical protein VGK56_17280 [Anaerolineales bacterium]